MKAKCPLVPENLKCMRTFSIIRIFHELFENPSRDLTKTVDSALNASLYVR